MVQFSKEAAKRIAKVVRQVEQSPVQRGFGVATRKGRGGGDGFVIEHHDTFPAIPTELTLIEKGDLVWHAMTGDTRWQLMSFVFTTETGEVGT